MANVYQVGGIQITLQPKKTTEPFLETAYGAFRALQFGDKFCNLLSLSGYATNFLKESAKVCNGGWTALAIPRVPGAFADMKKEMTALSEMSAIPGAGLRKYVNLTQAASSFTAVSCFAAAPFVSAAGKVAHLSSLLRYGTVSSGLADAYDFQRNAVDVWTAHTLATEAKKAGADSEIQTALSETRTLNAMKTAKAASGIAGFVLGGGIMASGPFAFPGSVVVLATLSLASAALAISASYYEGSMQNAKINFFSDKHVQHLQTQVA